MNEDKIQNIKKENELIGGLLPASVYFAGMMFTLFFSMKGGLEALFSLPFVFLMIFSLPWSIPLAFFPGGGLGFFISILLNTWIIYLITGASFRGIRNLQEKKNINDLLSK